MEIIIKINQNIEDNYASYEINTSDDAENCLFFKAKINTLEVTESAFFNKNTHYSKEYYIVYETTYADICHLVDRDEIEYQKIINEIFEYEVFFTLIMVCNNIIDLNSLLTIYEANLKDDKKYIIKKNISDEDLPYESEDINRKVIGGEAFTSKFKIEKIML